MSLLRDDRLIALHDLVEACRTSAQHGSIAAELLPDDPRAEVLHALVERRVAVADFFAARMIAEDDIPGGAPEELGLLETALARARAVFAEEGSEALLADCRVREEAVLRRAEAGQDAPLRNDEKAAARTLAEDAARSLRAL